MTTATTQPGTDEFGLHAEERLDRDAIEALQLERLQWTVRHAYENVPLYREKFDAAGVHPDDIKTLTDVQKLPFTTTATPLAYSTTWNTADLYAGTTISAKKRTMLYIN